MMRRWFSRRRAEGEPPPPHEAVAITPAVSWVDYAYLMLLWREADDRARQDSHRLMAAGQPLDELVARLVGSSEFRLVFESLKDGMTAFLRPQREFEARLRTLGSDEEFISRAYRVVLGRDQDPDGGAYYLSELTAGKARTFCLTALMSSDEFAARLDTLAPQAGFVPRDIQLCELANPAKWDNPDWRALLRSLHVVPADKMSMHRKGYELTQLLFGLSTLDAIGPSARVLSVGAGHEPVLFWLANRVAKTIATDTYGGVWQDAGAMEGDARVLQDPAAFAPFPYQFDRLLFMRMDGRRLAFRDETFDVVYSLSSIEHFGAFEGARECVDEMARVLRPQGILAVATEYCLDGPPHHEAFQPAEVHRLLDHPQLQLVQPIDEDVWRRYACTPVDLRVNRHQTPHMVCRDLGTTFTSVMAFLRKVG